ncbi:transporter substrate-binding protein [Martelella sp. HB161492]|uniref:transporter substrate-binding protein n=1 Tax=Martelella sp. HB161492 TaxID=2720726 RepID=UPI001590ACF8|nr:transporter substrate-binding protein [Martelella sp. HB161492]
MAIPVYPVTLLFSTSGAYAALGREALAGGLAAIADINADDSLAIRLEPHIADPGGSDTLYATLAEAEIRTGARHVVGTITSSSRKEVIPVVERHAALLWYAFPYEGYEASDRTLYVGACPNQHLLPLFAHVLPRYGSRVFIVGSNYIWGWEVARIARELAEAKGGTVLAERYLPLGIQTTEHLIAEIIDKRPDFILSNLVGESQSAFVRAYAALGRDNADFAPANRPVISCNLTDVDLEALGDDGAGHITASPYFDALDTAENRAFKARMSERHGAAKTISSPFASVYSATAILGQAIAEAGSDDPSVIREIVTTRQFSTPIGPISISRKTLHAALPYHLAEAGTDGRFSIFASSDAAMPADPYLASPAARAALEPPPERNSDRPGRLTVIK